MQKQSLQRAFTWHVFRILGHRIVKSSVTSEVVASCYFWHHSIRIAKDTSTKNAIVVSRFKPPNNNLLDTTKAIGWFCLGGSKAQIQNSKTPLQSMQLHLQVSGHISQKQFHSKNRNLSCPHILHTLRIIQEHCLTVRLPPGSPALQHCRGPHESKQSWLSSHSWIFTKQCFIAFQPILGHQINIHSWVLPTYLNMS